MTGTNASARFNNPLSKGKRCAHTTTTLPPGVLDKDRDKTNAHQRVVIYVKVDIYTKRNQYSSLLKQHYGCIMGLITA